MNNQNKETIDNFFKENYKELLSYTKRIVQTIPKIEASEIVTDTYMTMLSSKTLNPDKLNKYYAFKHICWMVQRRLDSERKENRWEANFNKNEKYNEVINNSNLDSQTLINSKVKKVIDKMQFSMIHEDIDIQMFIDYLLKLHILKKVKRRGSVTNIDISRFTKFVIENNLINKSNNQLLLNVKKINSRIPISDRRDLIKIVDKHFKLFFKHYA